MTRRRAVLLVANSAAPYSRGLRVARSLAAAGWDVEIAALATDDAPLEERDGDVLIRRYRPSGRWVRWAERPKAASSPSRARRIPALLLDRFRKTAFWPLPVRGWWATLRRELPPADLYHAFGILTIAVANDLAADARRHGRAGRVVYDVIDVILDSNNYSPVPAPILATYRFRERRWVRRADAIVTVNDPIADHIARIWSLPVRPTILINCQPRWSPPDPRPDLIRAATGVPPERRLVLFLGRLGRERGLEEAAEAVLAVDDTALVMLGFGPWAEQLRARDREPRFAGRHFTLPAVHPDDVPAWTASADVSIIAVPANSLNQRLSTPNKFWESLTAGTPVVVGRDLVVMREIVERERVGAIADPADPADLARGLRGVLDQPPAERAAMRDRALEVTRERYNWETAVVDYLALTQRLNRETD
ncbi:MAG TPA: glycosyltransferase [Candidatus Limnocylindrales bacterium]|nr:glycosyltransferase [Candidatus Limnocylindrales bacterium]